MHEIVSWDPSSIFFASSFTQKMPESSYAMHYPILMLKKYNIKILSEVDRINKKLRILFQFSSDTPGSITGTKLTIS